MMTNLKQWTYYLGLTVVILTHAWIIYAGLAVNQVLPHSTINILAAVAIYWAKK